MVDVEALVPAACFQHLFYHGPADGPMASTITLAISPSVERRKGSFAARIARELARVGDKVARLVRGQRRRAVLLHAAGPLAVTSESRAREVSQLPE